MKKFLGLTSLFMAVTFTLILPGIAEADTLYACKLNAIGTIRIVTATTICTQFEIKISWNTLRPPGPAGATGAQGLAGPQGPSGVSFLLGDVSGQATSTPWQPSEVYRSPACPQLKAISWFTQLAAGDRLHEDCQRTAQPARIRGSLIATTGH
jgi:hypothetical protein